MNLPEKTSNTFARALLVLSFVCLALIFLISGRLTSSTAQSPESSAQGERKLKLKTFKDIPVAIREVRNLQSDTWHKDLEIEVKNISDKPIYFMLAFLIFPDEPVPIGKSGIRLMYGDPKKAGHIDAYTDPTLDHIEPGATYVFTIPEIDRKGLEVKHKKFPGVDKNIELEFQIINFGDGTGFMGGRSRDYRGKGFTPPSPGEQIFKKIGWSIPSSTAIAPQDGCGSGNCFR